MKNCLYCGNDVKNKYCNTSCQNRHQIPLRKKKRIDIVKNCKKCNTEFIQTIIENGKSYIRDFCSRGCANSRIQTEEMNTSRSLKLMGNKNSVNSDYFINRNWKTGELIHKLCE
ncbi:MAG: hypothetical protein H8D94_00750 [Candidatus Pelagibacter sp.]|nr:hypothetical protein [Candidatus Pelagibacter sp.]